MSQPSVRQESEPSKLDEDFEYMIQEWLKQTTQVQYQVDLTTNFVALGFEFVGVEDQPKVTTEQIKAALSSRPINHYGPHRFFEEGMHGDYAPYVSENTGEDGFQANDVTTSDGLAVLLPSIWRISEACCGVEVVAYWEDTAYLKTAVEDRSSRTWESGRNIWIEIQMEYVDGFLSNVLYLAEKFGYTGKVRTRVTYRGLEGRRLNSPRSGAAFSLHYPSRQSRRDLDLTFELAALMDEVRSSAVAAIVQPLNKLFQGPDITADGVVKALDHHRRS